MIVDHIKALPHEITQHHFAWESVGKQPPSGCAFVGNACAAD